MPGIGPATSGYDGPFLREKVMRFWRVHRQTRPGARSAPRGSSVTDQYCLKSGAVSPSCEAGAVRRKGNRAATYKYEELKSGSPPR